MKVRIRLAGTPQVNARIIIPQMAQDIKALRNHEMDALNYTAAKCYGNVERYLVRRGASSLQSHVVVFFGLSDTHIYHAVVVNMLTKQIASDSLKGGKIQDWVYSSTDVGNQETPIRVAFDAVKFLAACVSPEPPLYDHLPVVSNAQYKNLKDIG